MSHMRAPQNSKAMLEYIHGKYTKDTMDKKALSLENVLLWACLG
jgi:hypothetical protein